MPSYPQHGFWKLADRVRDWSAQWKVTPHFGSRLKPIGEHSVGQLRLRECGNFKGEMRVNWTILAIAILVGYFAAAIQFCSTHAVPKWLRKFLLPLP